VTSEPERQIELDEQPSAADVDTPEAAAAPEVAVDAVSDAAPDAQPDAEPGFEFSLPAFTGPIELLVHLIERNELDITEVSLLAVTEQYLAYLRSRDQIDIGALAEFIAVGARLLLLKSRALLPRDPDEAPVQDEEESDVRQLIEALREYRRFKQAAEFLRDRDGTSGTYRRVAPLPKVQMPTGLESVTLSSLVDVIRDIMDRIPEEEPVGEVRREPVRLRDRITRLVGQLELMPRTSFRSLVQGATSRTEVIVDFMAVLELIKQRYLEAVQSESFGDIDLVRLEGAVAPLFGASNAAELEADFTD